MQYLEIIPSRLRLKPGRKERPYLRRNLSYKPFTIHKVWPVP